MQPLLSLALPLFLVSQVLTPSFAQEPAAPAAPFDFRTGIHFNFEDFQPAGIKTTTNGQTVVIDNVWFVGYGEEKGSWTKLYFHELDDNPKQYQPQLKLAVERFLTSKGFVVVAAGAPKLSVGITMTPRNTDPKGHMAKDGATMLYPSLSQVSIIAEVAFHWTRPTGTMGSTEMQLDRITNNWGLAKVDPPLKTGFLSFSAYAGKDALTYKPFVEAINSAVEQVMKKALDGLAQKMDQERVDDICRSIRPKP